MRTKPALEPEVEKRLASIYEEVMWLAKRPGNSPSVARAWYTHVMSVSLHKRIRMFSGKVSLAALEPDATLRLEHFRRMQTTLTQLVARHLEVGSHDKTEFLKVLLDCEQVHIVTFHENYAAMKAGGNYRKAGIKLCTWKSISPEIKQNLWKKMLRGKVANAAKFKP